MSKRVRFVVAGMALAATMALGACGDDDVALSDVASEDADDSDDKADDKSDDKAKAPEKMAQMMADGIVEGSDGKVTEEQATCIAQGILDAVPTSDLIRYSAEDADFESLPPEMQDAVFGAILDCVPADVLVELGQS